MAVVTTAPEVRAVGNIASGEGAIEPGLPTGTIKGDLLIMVCESGGPAGAGGEATTALTASGWTSAPSSPQVKGNTRLTVLYRIATGTDATLTNDTGNHQQARIIGIKGGTFDPSNIFNTNAGGTQAATTAVSILGGETTLDNCLIVACASGNLPDAVNTTEFGEPTNASLTGLTKRIGNAASAGDGGGVYAATGVLASKGAYSATTCTAVTSAERGVISLAINGGLDPIIRAVGAITSGAAAIEPGLPAGTETGDLLLMFAESGGATTGAEANTELTASGWTKVATEKKGNTRLTVLYRVATGTDPTTTNDTGDHQMARIVGVKKGTFNETTPINVSAAGTQASTKSVSMPGATTTVGNCLVFAAASGHLPDAVGTAEFSAQANASLAWLVEQIDNTVIAGDGAALGVAAGEMTNTGAYEATTATAVTEAERAVISFAVAPPSAGGGNVEIKPPAASATASVPSIIPTVAIAAIAALGTASASSPAPSVVPLPPAASATASSPASVPAVKVSGTIAGAIASAPAPVVQIATTVNAPPATATASAAALAPKIAPGAVAANATAGSSAPVPAVGIAGAPASATASAPAPSVVTALTITAPPAIATASSPAPVPAVRVSGTAASASASSGAPAAGIASVASAAIATASASPPAPSVAVGGKAAEAVASAPSPTFESDVKISAPAAIATVSAAAPVPAIASSPPVAFAVAATPASVPAVQIGGTAASAAASAPTPTIKVGESVVISAPSAEATVGAPNPSLSLSVGSVVAVASAGAPSAGVAVAVSASAATASAFVAAPSAAVLVTADPAQANAVAAPPTPAVDVLAAVAVAVASTPAPVVEDGQAAILTPPASASAILPMPRLLIVLPEAGRAGQLQDGRAGTVAREEPGESPQRSTGHFATDSSGAPAGGRSRA